MNNPIVDDLPAITSEQAGLARKMIYKHVPLKDSLLVLQILGLEASDKAAPNCRKCGFEMRRSNGKSWRCNRCRAGKK